MPRIKELFLLDIVVAIYKIKETIKSFTCGIDEELKQELLEDMIEENKHLSFVVKELMELNRA